MLYQEDVLTFCCQFKKLFVKTFSDYLDLIDGGFSSGHNWGILGGHPGQLKNPFLFAARSRLFVLCG